MAALSFQHMSYYRPRLEMGLGNTRVKITDLLYLRNLEWEMQKYPQIQSLKEANLLLGTRRTFGIYQIRDGSPGDNYAFMNILRPFLRFLASWFIYYAFW